MQNLTEKVISTETTYKGYIINVRRDNVLLSNGEEHFREVVEHPGGVVIIPILPDNKTILIRQWRHPAGQELIEFPAGKLNYGEDPFLAAKRELEEETGYTANKWESLGYIFTAPGFCDEKLYLYKAADLLSSQINPDFGEIVEPFIIDINNAWNMVKDGKIVDAKTIVGLGLILQK